MFEPNRVHNVDAYQAIKSIPDKSIDCIYTDIPYLYDSGGGGGSIKLSKRIKKVSKDYLKDISNLNSDCVLKGWSDEK